jgi:hypothetical protein
MDDKMEITNLLKKRAIREENCRKIWLWIATISDIKKNVYLVELFSVLEIEDGSYSRKKSSS